MDERPFKRARLETSNSANLALQNRGHEFGDVTTNGPAHVHLGDNFGVQNHFHYQQNSVDNIVDTDDTKCDILRKSVLFPRMDARVNNISKALHSTCTWLFRHKDFKEWHSDRTLRQHNGFLWIKGKPGCGKSTIMKTTLEWVQKQSRKKNMNRKVVYYFFNARASSSLEKSTLGLYRFLVYQLLDLYPSLRSYFVAKFAHKNPGLSGEEWTENELQDFLKDIVHLGKHCSLYILIDALDEGEEQRDVRDMIDFLVDLSEMALDSDSSLSLRICLSSRHYPHISVKKGLSLTVEDQTEHDRDIEIYVRKKLVGEDVATAPGGTSTEKLAAEVCRRSASIFLWVVLVVRLLHEVEDRGGSPNEAMTLLDTIPSDLNELFEKILSRSNCGIEACIALLQWVLFAARPLGPDELYLATEYSRSPANTDWKPSSEIVVPSEKRLALYVLECSRGLVELTTGQRPVVQFIHETVRDYLLNSNELVALFPAMSTNLAGISHEVLKTACARYIARCEVPEDLRNFASDGYINNGALEMVKERLRTELPLIEYSVSQVFNHAEQAQLNHISQRRFLQNRTTLEGDWCGDEQAWLNVLERFKVRKYRPNVTLLYFLAERGSMHLLTELLRVRDPSTYINEVCGRYGTALSAACVNGHEDMVRSLLASNAKVNGVGGDYRYPFLAAIYNEHYSLAPILQTQERCTDARSLRKAIRDMVDRGSTQGVKILLEFGTRGNWRDSMVEMALRLAIEKGQKETVDLLLYDESFRVVSSTVIRRSFDLLSLASKHGFEEIVRRIIQNPSFGTQDERTRQLSDTLLTACRQGHLEMTRLLIANGADVNAQSDLYGPECRNGLHMACIKGFFGIAKLLIESGAEVNAWYVTGESALAAACSRGHKDIAKLLIESGAEVNARSMDDWRALTAACSRGHKDIAKLLIESGAKVNEWSMDGRSALVAACSYGRKDIAKLLIESGAEVNSRSNFGRSALAAACYYGHNDIAKLLIENGANVNAQELGRETALYIAAEKAESEIVRLLIQHGADVNVRAGNDGKTALGNVLYRFENWLLSTDQQGSYDTIIQLLREAGAE